MKINMKQGLIALMLFAGFSASYAEETCSILSGNMTCHGGTINKLTANGIVKVGSTVITGPTVVNGLLSAANANFMTLEVNGSAHLTECVIMANAQIKGYLSATATRFEGQLKIYANAATLSNSKVLGDLHVFSNKPNKHLVYLENGSEVTGNIIFNNGNGEVIVRENSRIHGKVLGGKIARK
jgi:cytoskeletal protein CcmA (bactofilin family)